MFYLFHFILFFLFFFGGGGRFGGLKMALGGKRDCGLKRNVRLHIMILFIGQRFLSGAGNETSKFVSLHFLF